MMTEHKKLKIGQLQRSVFAVKKESETCQTIATVDEEQVLEDERQVSKENANVLILISHGPMNLIGWIRKATCTSGEKSESPSANLKMY